MDHCCQLMSHQDRRCCLQAKQASLVLAGAPTLLASSFPHSPLLQKSHRVLQHPSPSVPSKGPEQHAPCQRTEGPAKDHIPASHWTQMLEVSRPSSQVPHSPHHAGLEPNGMRHPLNLFPTQTRGTANCPLGTADGAVNHRLQTRERRQPVSLGSAFVERGTMLDFFPAFFFL